MIKGTLLDVLQMLDRVVKRAPVASCLRTLLAAVDAVEHPRYQRDCREVRLRNGAAIDASKTSSLREALLGVFLDHRDRGLAAYHGEEQGAGWDLVSGATGRAT